MDAPVGEIIDTPFGRVQVSHVCLNDGVVEGLRCLDGERAGSALNQRDVPGREPGEVGRLGGDEFQVLLPDMDDRGTLNTSLRHEEDDFGTYSRQQSLSLSYGNRVIENERAHLDLQVGPGFRRAYDTIDDRNEASFIGRGLIDMRYALSENTEIVNKLLVESGEYNTFAQNDLGVSVTMNSHLALKAGWQARHNSDVAPDRKRTDTLTTMNVVYRFK